MTIAQQVAKVSASIESADRVNEFVSGVRYLMLGRGGAETLAEKERAPSRVIEFVKSPQAAGSMTGWAQPLAPFQNLATAFLASLTGVSAFDALWPSMLQAPLRMTVVAVSAVISGSGVGEGGSKPASRLSLSGNDLDATKCAVFVALSAELLRMDTPSALAILQAELRKAIARATNNIFLPILTASAPAFVSSGITALGVRQDLRVLLSAVSSGADSKLFLIVTRKIAEAWSVLPDSTGAGAFPTANVNGGSIGGIPIVVVDEATDGEIILADATQIAAGQEGLVLDSTTQASVQLDTAADSPPASATPYISLWQADLLGLRAERYIGAKVMRSDCVARITGAQYSGNSPA